MLTKRHVSFLFLSLISLSIFNLLVFPVSATTYLSDNFESYTTGWTTGAGSGGATDKSSTEYHGGSYSARIFSPATAAYAYAYQGTSTVSTNYHVQIWIKINGTCTAASKMPVIAMWDTTAPGYYTVWCCFYYVTDHFVLRNGYGGGKPPSSFEDICVITADAWHLIDAYVYRGVGNKVAYWVDGVDKGDFTVNNDRGTNRYVFGDTMSTDVAGGFWIDDLVFDDASESAPKNLSFDLSEIPAITTSIARGIEIFNGLSIIPAFTATLVSNNAWFANLAEAPAILTSIMKVIEVKWSLAEIPAVLSTIARAIEVNWNLAEVPVIIGDLAALIQLAAGINLIVDFSVVPQILSDTTKALEVRVVEVIQLEVPVFYAVLEAVSELALGLTLAEVAGVAVLALVIGLCAFALVAVKRRRSD